MMFEVYSVDYYFTVSADNSAVSDLSEFEDHEETLCPHRSGGDADRPQATTCQHLHRSHSARTTWYAPVFFLLTYF